MFGNVDFKMLANSSVRSDTLLVSTPLNRPLFFLDPINVRLTVGTTAGSETIATNGNLRVGNIVLDTDTILSDGNINLSPTGKVNIPLTSLVIPGGAAGNALTTDGNGNLTWTQETTSPGGQDMSVQYNAAGSFAGSTNLLWNYNNNTLLVGGSNYGNITSNSNGAALHLYTFDNLGQVLSQIELGGGSGIIFTTGGGEIPFNNFTIGAFGQWEFSGSSAGSSGQVIVSNGNQAQPVWATLATVAFSGSYFDLLNTPANTAVATTTTSGSGITENYATPTFLIPANTLQAGKAYEITLDGSLTANVANTSAIFNIRLGTTGSVTDTLLLTNYCDHNTTGQDPFDNPNYSCTVRMSVRSVGATGSIVISSTVSANVNQPGPPAFYSSGQNIVYSGIQTIDTTQDLYFGVSVLGTDTSDANNVYQAIVRQL